ncbi:MAG: asparagine synthase-related protein [Myxococcota bacterium]|nr:asparagine synthase-related protein [Myxococcota bacterium]
MTIAALWEAVGQTPGARAYVAGLEFDTVGKAPEHGRAWLASQGSFATRCVDGDLVVASETIGGPDASEIARAFRLHGTGCTSHLSPPFTFVLFDSTARLLLAASDAACRAPLVYWFDAKTIAVSSRALHLLAHPRASRSLDETHLAHLLTGFWSAPAGTTPLEGVRRLLPGVALVARAGIVELVAFDRLIARGPTRAVDRAAWVDAFWEQLDAALDRLFVHAHPTCLALSGGLDSAAIASAIARRQLSAGRMAAFSIVAPRREADESAAIAKLEEAYSDRIENHRLDCSDAIDLTALDDSVLADDPNMTPLALLPSRLRLWRAAEDAGFRAMIDGEGGDELFSVLFGAREAIRQGRWSAAWQHLQSRRGARRATLARAFVLPLLSKRAQRAWASRRVHDVRRRPSYLGSGAAAQRAFERATQAFYEAQIELDFAGETTRWLSNPAIAGAFATQRQIASTFGIALVSPLLDRRVIELVLAIPAEWMLSREPKAFLPDAAAGRVPDAIRLQSKDIRLPSDLLRTIVSHPGVRRTVRDPVVRERLDGWVRFERVESVLDAIAQGYDPADDLFWAQIAGLVSFSYWYARASREYGVR